MLPNFQFSIFNFQSISKNLIFKFKNSFQIILIFSLLLSIFYLLPSVAYADTAPQANPSAGSGQANYPVANTNPDVPNNLHNWTQNVMIEVMSSLTCQLAGVDPTNPKQSCLGIDQTTGKIGFAPSGHSAELSRSPSSGGGAIGVMGKMISVLYTPPAHTADYFQNLAADFGISKKAYAQGAGFTGLSPLMNIWSTFRNVVYLIFVIVFVVIGLAIMLRIKIDPRTVMTIQNQIPKIIIGILLVTFSFAIAGFLIDLMWVIIYLAYGTVAGIPSVDLNVLNPSAIAGQNALRVAGHISTGGIFGITWNVANSAKDVLKNFMGVTGCESIGNCFNNLFNPLNFVFNTKEISVFNILFNIISAFAGTTMFFKVASIPNTTLPILSELEALFKTGGGLTAGVTTYATTQFLLREFLPTLIVYLIIFIALLSALFRLWFSLLMAYVYILLDVVLAPFWIIAGLIPGSQFSFTGWLRSITANLLAFPATIVMFLLGKVFMDAFKSGTAGQQFVPPLIGTPGDTALIGDLIGLGFILVTPSVVSMLKQALKAPKIDISAIGAAIGVGTGAPGGVFNKAGQLGFSLSGMANVPGLNRLPIIKNIRGGGGGAVHPPPSPSSP